MSQVPSRPSSPKPTSGRNFVEASLGDGTTPDVTTFVEPQIFIKIQGAIFGLPRSRVLKSGLFRAMIESPHLGDSNEGSADYPIIVDDRAGITEADMQSFCAVLDLRAFEPAPTFSTPEWAAAYRLLRMWEFEQLGDYIFKHLDESITDAFTRIHIADVLGLDQWIAPALAQLCHREASLTAAEGERLGFKRFAEVCRLREHVRQQFPVSNYERWLNKERILKKY
ncbi:hypothetical protein FRC00_005329 [Tulasnella sp. 408]|nr:hypothetical protein FRC00_005329 [Tulasnella sp. 408]